MVKRVPPSIVRVSDRRPAKKLADQQGRKINRAKHGERTYVENEETDRLKTAIGNVNAKKQPPQVVKAEQRRKRLRAKAERLKTLEAEGSVPIESTRPQPKGTGTANGKKRGRPKKPGTKTGSQRREQAIEELVELEEELQAKGIPVESEHGKEAMQIVTEAREMVGKADELFYVNPQSKAINITGIETVQQRAEYRRNVVRWREQIATWIFDGLTGDELRSLLRREYGASKEGAAKVVSLGRRAVYRKCANEVSKMIALRMQRSQIVAIYKERYPHLAYKHVGHIIALARRQHQEHLTHSPEQNKADSLAFWADRLQQAESRRGKAFKELDRANELVEKVTEMIGDSLMGTDQYETLERSLESALGLKKHATQVIAIADGDVKSIQDRIDRMIGNYASERINLTVESQESSGNLKPITRQEQRSALVDMAGQLAELLSPEKREQLLTSISQGVQSPIDLPIIIDAEYAEKRLEQSHA